MFFRLTPPSTSSRIAGAIRVDHPPGRRDFREHPLDELLAPEAGVDGHDQQEIDIGQDRLDQAERRRRVQGDPGFEPLFADHRDRPVKMGRRLHMDRDPVAPGLREGVDVLFGIFDHQVDVEGKFRGFPDRGDEPRADRDVGDEMAVHDVDVNPVRSRGLDGNDLFAETAEVRRQDGWCDHLHGRIPTG